MVKKAQKTPDWLQPEGQGGPAMQQQPQREERRRRTRDDDDDEDGGKAKKGIRWGPIVLLLLIIVPSMLPTLIEVFSKLQNMGFVKLPSVSAYVYGSKYRPCLQEFYADWAPEKLGQLDATLSKYEGREKQLFAILGKKYGKKVQTARCT